MIDVVFLLLVFFMLAARFGQDMVIDLPITAASDKPYEGPPRLVDIYEETVSLNGVTVSEDTLVSQLSPLMEKPENSILLRAKNETDLQRLISVMELLAAEGYSNIVLVE